jgi:hypothetical protein
MFSVCSPCEPESRLDLLVACRDPLGGRLPDRLLGRRNKGAAVDVPIDVRLYDLWSNAGIDPWRNSEVGEIEGAILCFGPRGCGKTFLGKKLAKVTRKEVQTFPASELLKDHDNLSKYLADKLARTN